MVPLLVILTIIVFILVDLALRLVMRNLERRKVRKSRQAALDSGLRLDFTDEALSLKRVAVDKPKARILAVDDEEIVLSSFRKILALDGFSIDTVERGKEALGLIQKNDYDFVFVDLKMPEMDGVDVTKAVKHLRPDIDVVVITGYATVESAVETMKYGAMDYVQKPFTEEELVEYVNKFLIRRQDRIERLSKPQIHLITPSIDAEKSKHVVNVPAGVFVSPSHTWVSLELNGTAKVGLDDFTVKILGPVEAVELPKEGRKVEKGAPLFIIRKGEHGLEIPSPITGKVVSVNANLLENMEYLQMKPYELGWICAMEPANLPGDLQALVIGADTVSWYKEEVDKFSEEFSKLRGTESKRESAEEEKKRLEDEAWEAFRRLYLGS
jgi:FixJ family two-component response regulator/glycine cleavage system H lipoate-binding protein